MSKNQIHLNEISILILVKTIGPTVRLGCELILFAMGKQLMPGINRKVHQAQAQYAGAENIVVTRG